DSCCAETIESCLASFLRLAPPAAPEPFKRGAGRRARWSPETLMPLLDEELKELLVCPACHGELDEDEAASRLRCRACGRTYPVREFPVMLLEETETPGGAPSGGAPSDER